MRDLSGVSTRVNVDVSLTQVPQYQVDSGRDQASQAVTGSKAAFPEQQAEQGLGGAKATSGPNSATTKTTTVTTTRTLGGARQTQTQTRTTRG